jgi:biopolymer transport protein ExbB/TolQ
VTKNVFIVLLLYIVFLLGVPLISNEVIAYPSFEPAWFAQLNQAKYGIFHIPSLIFIGGAFVILQLSEKVAISETSLRGLQKEIADETAEFIKFEDTLETSKEPRDLYQCVQLACANPNRFGRLVTLISSGCSENDIRLKLAIDIAQTVKNAQERVRHNGLMAGMMPLLGMIGTITGLMFIFSGNQVAAAAVEDTFDNKFAAMGTALLTTLYSTLFTAIWFKPRQHKLTLQLNQLKKDTETIGHHCVLLMHKMDINLLHHQTIIEQESIKTNVSSEEEKGEEDSESSEPVEPIDNDFDLNKYKRK